MSAVHSSQTDSPGRSAKLDNCLGSVGSDKLLGGQFCAFAAFLGFFYAVPLGRLFLHSWEDEVQSYILLIPLISGYLTVTGRHRWLLLRRTRQRLAVVPALLGMVAVAVLGLAILGGVIGSGSAKLSLLIFSFLCLLTAGGFWFLGALVMRQLAFPAAFLVFMIPIPPVAMEGINIFLQHASAEAANMMLTIGGPPFVRDGLLFQLPGITLFVAEECSGVRSTLVLFITSTLASYLFLRSGWRRTLLVAVVLPIAILRNGFRIYVIAMLCVHIDPSMIHSIIHKRGGPLFFALSLIPLFGLLVWLRRKEQNGAKALV